MEHLLKTHLANVNPIESCSSSLQSGEFLQTCQLSDVMSHLNGTQYAMILTMLSFTAMAPLFKIDLKMITVDIYVVVEGGNLLI